MIGNAALIGRIETQFPFVRELTGERRRELLHAALYAQLPAGQTVCEEGTLCSHLALMLGGVARVFKLSESGRDITLYRVSPGQSCILTASCILSATPFPALAVCEEDCEAVLLPTAQVRRWIADSEPFRGYVFGVLAQRLTDVIGVVEEVVFRRVDRRLAAYLARRGGLADRGAPIRATHQEIASDLGTSREVVSRILKDFEGRGLISLGRAAVEIIDVAGLQAAARAT